MKILQSASKLVFVLLALSACVGFFVGRLESKDFMLLAGMAFSFYFANKGETSVSGSTDSVPYAGK
jgi:putative solute:sodium symporter small subunit